MTLIAENLRCEYLTNPLGIDSPTPRLSWTLAATDRHQYQLAYQILVASSPEMLAAARGDIWDSGRVESAQTAQIVYAGAPLVSGQRVWWAVRVWNRHGTVSDYSAPSWWQMGLLNRADWQGTWIGLEADPIDDPANDMQIQPPVYLRRGFALDKPVSRATLHIAAKGVTRLTLNGARASTAELAPDWSDYHHRALYQSYDVTALLQPGENVLGAVLGTGWYAGYLGYQSAVHFYGETPRLLAQLHITHDDGSVTQIASDPDWQAHTGPVLFSDMQMGEAYDARREMPGWDRPSFAAGGWSPVTTADDDAIRLTAQPSPPIRVLRTMNPQSISQPQPGVFIFDLEQNMVGRVQMKVQGPAGTRVTLRYGEILEPDGTLHTANLRRARATDTYILKGDGVETYESLFTFHGFRYVEITGYPGEPDLTVITGQVMHNDLPDTGTFECSSPMINQLWSNIVWGQRGNFLAVPTDCPQRDERLGWTADIQVFTRTATFNMDVAAFLTKWLDDLSDGQTADGGLPDVAPRIADQPAAPGWGDAAIIVPWVLYQVYADTRIIDRHLNMMTGWMDYIHAGNPGLVRTERLNNNYGDWVALDDRTPKDLAATAYWAYCARLLAEMAAVIDRTDIASTYRQLYQDISAAFLATYLQPDGTLQGDTQTCYVLALHMIALDDRQRQAFSDLLVQRIADRDGHLSTGFMGTPYLNPVLTATGHVDVAYQLLLNDTFPSWGYMVRQGATTMWERWNSYTVEGGIYEPGMNSFNHYAYGSIGEWLYRDVAGIDLAEPGYRKIVIHPHTNHGLEAARAEYRSIHGIIRTNWSLEKGRLHLEVTVPVNTTAAVYLPPAATIQENHGPLGEADGIISIVDYDGGTIITIGSGEYYFTAQ